MGWLRKFLGIEPNDHSGLNNGVPSGNNHRGTLFMDDDNDLLSHFSTFDFPSQWSGTSPNITVIDPIEELENMMQDLFEGSGSMFRSPDHHHHGFNAPPTRPTNPRDQLLKQPDSEVIPSSGDDIDSRSQPSSEHPEGKEPHRSMQPFNPDAHERHSLSSLLDHLMDSFGRMGSSNSSTSREGRNFLDHQPETSPRDAMIKKDTDLDELTESSGLDSLLSKESPSYNYYYGDGSPCAAPQMRPEGGSGDQGWLYSFPGGGTHVQRSFTSTSIRRIVRPDGSIEERRTYRDSSGKEEVTVTEMDPATAGTVLSKDDFFGNSGSGNVLGSFFRRLF